ncbi:MAG: DJ-1/PfpI family protein [Oscillospiraceae bacterium]|nr:DJ-1/PfpI family protein [Oscillospiraceae bacterium]MBQ7130804.1 DJ-1/PfpI family protein [Oscillospiraceae bacterium]
MVYMLLGTGFEETEAIAPLDLLRRAGVEVRTVGVTGKIVYGSHGIGIEADILMDEIDLNAMEMIVLPGGLGGVASARASKGALDALKYAWDNGRFVAAICAGPTVLADLGITDGRKATCFPGCEDGMGNALMQENMACVRDGKLITGTSAGCAIPFGLALIEALKGSEEARRIATQIVIR